MREKGYAFEGEAKEGGKEKGNALYFYCDHCGKSFTCPRVLRR